MLCRQSTEVENLRLIIPGEGESDSSSKLLPSSSSCGCDLVKDLGRVLLENTLNGLEAGRGGRVRFLYRKLE